MIVHYANGRERAEETVHLITEAGGSARCAHADLRDTSGIRSLVATSGPCIDILVNNAGMGLQRTLEHTTEDDFDTIFSTNVRGAFFLTQALVPTISDHGAIINISSMVSMVAYPSVIAYAMSKAAQNAFTLSLAADLAPRGIRVNGVAPGATDSDFLSGIKDNDQMMAAIKGLTAFGRLGTPDDIARAVTFLASPDNSWITGQVIQVSGGMHL
ncbi:SDR family NAD(P)-dependent oxidoreductase [Sphingomonas aliaeris]|uniref:SDR family NAD(P)-dependent oxidoreductase n=1 Tax=Sphingomonas aliaeris TaxID=2759526 RepID=UPI0021F1E50E|nr:SDR family oxidoreductase [Sphingomonas aliaeris]